MTYNPLWNNATSQALVDAGAITFASRVKATGAAGAAPAKGGTRTEDNFRYNRFGDQMVFRASYRQTAAGTGVASVFYTFKLPGALVINTTKMPVIGGGVITESQMGRISNHTCGIATMQTQSGSDLSTFGRLFAYLDNEFAVAVNTSALWDGDSGFDWPDNPAALCFMGSVPIVGW